MIMPILIDVRFLIIAALWLAVIASFATGVILGFIFGRAK